MNKPKKSIKNLRKIRSEISASLPIGHSFIPLDILLVAYCGDDSGDDLTVKALFASLPYSDMGIRYHFKKLLIDGWLELDKGAIDTRIKKVRASQKLNQRFINLDEKLSKFLKNL